MPIAPSTITMLGQEIPIAWTLRCQARKKKGIVGEITRAFGHSAAQIFLPFTAAYFLHGGRDRGR